MVLQLAFPFLGLFTNILSQVICFKYIIRGSLLKSEYLGFACGLLLFAAGELLSSGNSQQVNEWLGLVFVNFLIYICFSYYYFSFINMGETARRIRILRELKDAGAAGLSQDELLRRYNSGEIISIRMERLLNNKQVVIREGRYYTGKPAMLLISKLIVLVKLVVLGKRSEFEK